MAAHHLPGTTRPSQAQLDAGNYPKARVTFQGLPITIENPRGSTRRGRSRAGHEWQVTMLHDYGYIRGTEGTDGDHFDVYLGPHPDAPMAYLVNTMAPPTFSQHDEQKAMLGFRTELEARQAYLAHYDNPRFLGSITPMPMARFRELVLATRGAPAILKAAGTGQVLFLKAHVRAHDRHQADGSVVHVNAHEDRRRPGSSDIVEGVTSYRSGATAPNIIRGYIVSGTPLGVSMRELGPGSASWDMMLEYARRGGQVFVDTGAFTAFQKQEPMDWPKVMQAYRRIIEQGEGGRLHVVAPDVIGDQAASLDVLEQYRDQVLELMDHGHDVLVPVQKGAMSPYIAWRAATHILGTDDFTASVPSNAAAFTPADLTNLVSGPEKPPRIHLLGIAGNKKKLAELVRIIRQHSPDTIITSDAARIRAQVGEGRPITVARERWKRTLADAFQQLAAEQGADFAAAWRDQAEEALKPAVAAAAISQVESDTRAKPPPAQADLFAKGGLILFAA